MAKPVAVVTGGSAGIGAAICRHLLDADYHVVSLARRAGDMTHPHLETVQVDLADPEATRAAAAEVAGRRDVTAVVHNAGVIRPALIEDAKAEDLTYLVNLHMQAAIELVQAFLPAMKAAKFGRIVNMSSRAVVGLPTRTHYAGTKAALISMTRTWAMELGKYGITVNAIAPGPIVTDMFTDVIPEESAQAQRIAEGLPVGRLGTADDVARATLFFLSPHSGFITGQTLYVCGGASLGSLTL